MIDVLFNKLKIIFKINLLILLLNIKLGLNLPKIALNVYFKSNLCTLMLSYIYWDGSRGFNYCYLDPIALVS